MLNAKLVTMPMKGGHMDILEWFSSLRKRYHMIIALLLTMAIGYVDYVTGYELRMELFYLLPISYATWFVGQRFGILFSVLSIITTEYSDILAGKKYTNISVEFLNGAMYFVFYVIVTVLLKLRKTLQQRESLIAELDRSLNQNEELSALLPVCASCKKFRTDQEYRQKVESYISKQGAGECSRSLCKECAAGIASRISENG
jgi:hypothetical protein